MTTLSEEIEDIVRGYLNEAITEITTYQMESEINQCLDRRGLEERWAKPRRSLVLCLPNAKAMHVALDPESQAEYDQLHIDLMMNPQYEGDRAEIAQQLHKRCAQFHPWSRL